MADGQVDVTFLTCTYNRAADLEELLESAVRQQTGGRFTYEILVVDNNSRDNTRAVVEKFIREYPALVRYLFEPRQGKSFALNTGLAEARGRFYAIADDDLVYPADYLQKLHAAWQAHPDVSVIAGKVLPLWKAPQPQWLSPLHWAPIAMSDFGPVEFRTGMSRSVCLLAGAYRRDHVLALNGYNTELGVAGRCTGGIEDADIMDRLYAAGRGGVYRPEIEVFHKVEPERTTRAYHRRWHLSHGRQYAIRKDAKFEAGKWRLLAVPGHVYRTAFRNFAAWIKCELQRKEDEAFWHETQLWFFFGFFQARFNEIRAPRR